MLDQDPDPKLDQEIDVSSTADPEGEPKPPRRSPWPTVVGVLLLAAVTAVLNFAVRARTDALNSADAGPTDVRPLPVRTVRLVPEESLTVPRTFTGRVAARRTSALAFEGSGLVTRVLVDDGDVVTKGQLLAELDTELLVAQRNATLAALERLRAQLDELVAGPRDEVVEAAKADVASVDRQLELAVLQRDRRKSLVDEGTIGVEELDTVESRVQTLTAQRASAAARLLELENGTRAETLAAQRSSVAEAEAGLTAIDIQIAKARLVAPYDGRVSARMLDEGAVVSQQMPAPALELVEDTALEARVGVPAALVEGVLDDVPESLVVHGREVRVTGARALPVTNGGTRTVTLVFELEASAASVRPGDVVTLRRRTVREGRGAWVPLAALRESSRGLWTAYSLAPAEDDPSTRVVERVELEVLHSNEERAFVRGTFDGPLTIVADGAHRLVAGQVVAPIDEAAARTGARIER